MALFYSKDKNMININVDYVLGVYPDVLDWRTQDFFSPAVNIPTLRVVFYFFPRIVASAMEEERTLWDRIIWL